MTFVRTLIAIATLTGASLATSAWATPEEQHDSHHPASPTAVMVAQAKPAAAAPGMGGMGATGMPGMGAQMSAMQDMHNKMLTAKTQEERNALMTEQMKLMQNGMNMMGGMGPGAMMGNADGMPGRLAMMEQRMQLMQSMMQMMMDRMPSAPAPK